MNTTYKSLPTLASRDVTLLLGASIGSNIDASLSHSKEILGVLPSGSVLYINTVQNTHAMWLSLRKQELYPDRYGNCLVGGDHRKMIYTIDVPRGDLYRCKDMIKECLSEGYIQYVVINSWEFSSKNSRYREEAIFLIKDLVNGLQGGYEPVHVLIYAEETSSKPLAQKLQRGGFGKLAGIAKRIESITVKEQYATTEEIDEMLQLPEVQEIIEIPDPRIGTEDEPGISDEEIQRRFLARVKPLAKKEWEEKKIPFRTAIQVASELDEARIRDEVSVVRESESIVLPTTGEQRTTAPPTINDAAPATRIPLTSIEELRKTPEPLSKMPIHLNHYSPDKAPIARPAKTGDVHSDIRIK